MIYLCIDFGNTLQKVAVVENGKICNVFRKEKVTVADLEKIYCNYDVTATILSSVVHTDEAILNYLRQKPNFQLLSFRTPMPIRVGTDRPELVGADLIAACIGAKTKAPQNDVLILQFGTCLTHQFVSKDGLFSTTSIAPGLKMRFRSLHEYTQLLPEIEPTDYVEISGKNTVDAILAGVVQGIVAEAKNIIETYRSQYSNLRIFISGGDAAFLQKYLPSDVILEQNLVLEGLIATLNYNNNLSI